MQCLPHCFFNQKIPTLFLLVVALRLTMEQGVAFTTKPGISSLVRIASKQSTESIYVQTQRKSPTSRYTLLFSTTQNSDKKKDASIMTSSRDETSTVVQKSNKLSSSSDALSRLQGGGVASAAALATAAVNAAVSMRKLEAPSVQKSYISRNATGKASELDGEGLPLVYDKDLIEAYWAKEKNALSQRWNVFVGKAIPFFTKLVQLWIRDGKISDSEIPALARQARIDLQELGSTFIKLGQILSSRPDVLPSAALAELELLQDSVEPFDSSIAISQIEKELGGPLGQFFTSISEEPVAAASLAQVYLATLNDGKDTKVAVKIQRPNVLSSVSKDLYVLRRAVEVFQGLVERFAPQQKTNYVALLNEWAVGFYTELDFQNEASNQRRLRESLIEKGVKGIVVPKTYDKLCTRRILVSEWMDGIKLSSAPREKIAEVTPIAQEAFLTQLLEIGFFHADPHPGNILLLNEATSDGATLALIDCGLMATIDPADRDNMVSAVIHLANKDYASLVDDFVKLNILPPDSNRPAIIPLMDKALTPYVKGGGAKRYEEELKKIYGMEDGSVQSNVGGFQAMTQDALTVLNDVPFSIPPYFAILGRAIVTLEGVALSGDPDYGIIMESYPFIARKLMREGRPEVQKALQEVLYSGHEGSGGFQLSRLLVLLNNAAGAVSTQEGAAFVDLDTVPDDGLSLEEGMKFVLSDGASSLRTLLENEIEGVLDVLFRQGFRRAFSEAIVSVTPPSPPSLPFVGNIFPAAPSLEDIPLPLVLPPKDLKNVEEGNFASLVGRSSVALMTLREFVDVLVPKLDQDEEVFAIGLGDGAKQFFGEEVASIVKGENLLSVDTVNLALSAVRSGALGRPDLISNQAVSSVLGSLQSTLDSLVKASQRSRASSDNIFEKFRVASASLTPEERLQLDNIIDRQTRRLLNRCLERLSKVDRVL